eukprot:Stramenopile-MAST_4_protein_3085
MRKYSTGKKSKTRKHSLDETSTSQPWGHAHLEADFEKEDDRFAQIKDASFYRSKLSRLVKKYEHAIKPMKEKIAQIGREQEFYEGVLWPKYVQVCKDVEHAKETLLDLKFAKKYMDKALDDDNGELGKQKMKKNIKRMAEKKLGKLNLTVKTLNEELLQIIDTRKKHSKVFALAEKEYNAVQAEHVAHIERRVSNLGTGYMVRYKILTKKKNETIKRIENYQSQIVAMTQNYNRLHKELLSRKWCYKHFDLKGEIDRLHADVAGTKQHVNVCAEARNKIAALELKVGVVETETKRLKAKANQLDIEIGGCYLENKEEYLNKNFELTKHIMKLEHMAMLYRDRQNETKWYISMLLAHISKQVLERQNSSSILNTVDAHTVMENHDVDTFSTAQLVVDNIDMKKTMIEQMRKCVIEHEVLDKTEPRIFRALDLMRKKLTKYQGKLDGIDIEKAKIKGVQDVARLSRIMQDYKERTEYGKRRVEKISAEYAKAIVELNQSETSKRLRTLEQQMQYHVHVNYHGKETLKEILREYEREQRRGKVQNKLAKDVTITDVSDQVQCTQIENSLPYASLSPGAAVADKTHWLLDSRPVHDATRKLKKNEVLVANVPVLEHSAPGTKYAPIVFGKNHLPFHTVYGYGSPNVSDGSGFTATVEQRFKCSEPSLTISPSLSQEPYVTNTVTNDSQVRPLARVYIDSRGERQRLDAQKYNAVRRSTPTHQISAQRVVAPNVEHRALLLAQNDQQTLRRNDMHVKKNQQNFSSFEKMKRKQSKLEKNLTQHPARHHPNARTYTGSISDLTTS